MPIAQRTIKLTLATVFSLALSHFLHLQYAPSAGIIAILSVLDTRRSSLKTAYQRLGAAILALMIAAACFSLFHYTLASLALYMLCYVPLTYRFHLQAGIAPSTVLVTHLLSERSISLPWLGNELALFLIGTGLALLFNSYMPSHKKTIQAYHQQVEAQLKHILLEFSHQLAATNKQLNLHILEDLHILLKEALQVVYLERHNQVFRQTNYFVHYFEMRREQNRMLQNMAQTLYSCSLESEESLILSQLFEKTAHQLGKTNAAYHLMEEIAAFLTTFRNRKLPKTRQEFETRAQLFQLLQDLKQFILLKVHFYEEYKEEDKLF